MTFLPTNDSWPGSVSGKDALAHGTAYYRPKGINRYEGPALPPNGTPTPTASLENLNERLERLAFPTSPTSGAERAPLETYGTTSEPYGDVYRATHDYVRWFVSRYPGSGGGDQVQGPGPGRAAQAVGEGGRFKQNAGG